MLLPLKTGIASVLDKTQILSVLRTARSRRGGLVLAFHRVLNPADVPACYDREVAITAPVFENLLLLLRHEFQIVPLHDLLHSPQASDGRQRVALTFDDGWEDTSSVAFPILMKYQAPATIFLCTGLMGQNAMLPEERFARIWKECVSRDQLAALLYDLSMWEVQRPVEVSARAWGKSLKHMPYDAKERLLSWLEGHYGVPADGGRRFLTWDEAAAMRECGIAFGSHTVRHATLGAEPYAALMEELVTSRKEIELRLNTRCSVFAYPNGVWDHRIMDAVRESGYDFAFTIERGLCSRASNPLAMPRIPLADSMLTDASLRFNASRARFALQQFSGSPISFSNSFHLLPGPQQI